MQFELMSGSMTCLTELECTHMRPNQFRHTIIMIYIYIGLCYGSSKYDRITYAIADVLLSGSDVWVYFALKSGNVRIVIPSYEDDRRSIVFDLQIENAKFD